ALLSADFWNDICWEGSLRGYAAQVLSKCERAAELAPEDWHISDSRGLARALTGNVKGAIDDFQALIKSTDNPQLKAQRQRWVEALSAGKNPFTPEELRSLNR